MNAAGYDFQDGPYDPRTTNFSQVPGIYLITDNNKQPLDCGQTDNLSQRMNSHERMDSWYRCAGSGEPYLYFLWEPNESNRLQIESKIRATYPFVCGVR